MKRMSKRRSDIALTQEVVHAVFERLETGLPLLRRGSKYLLLEGQKWANKIPVGTYSSWRTRNTIPIDSVDNKGFNELLTEKRNKLGLERQEELIRLGERGLENILSMPMAQKTVEKRINKAGEKVVVTTIQTVNPATINAKVKVAMFALERLNGEAYGKPTTVKQNTFVFSLAELRKYKEEHKK